MISIMGHPLPKNPKEIEEAFSRVDLKRLRQEIQTDQSHWYRLIRGRALCSAKMAVEIDIKTTGLVPVRILREDIFAGLELRRVKKKDHKDR